VFCEQITCKADQKLEMKNAKPIRSLPTMHGGWFHFECNFGYTHDSTATSSTGGQTKITSLDDQQTMLRAEKHNQFSLPCTDTRKIPGSSGSSKSDENVFAYVADEVVEKARNFFCSKKKKGYCRQFEMVNAKIFSPEA
ncbi:unnamed protein product, partial [Amoebophrya sp. A120]